MAQQTEAGETRLDAGHRDLAELVVLETEEGDFCWVNTSDGPRRRSLRLGDTNDVFIVVEAGLKEGDEVFLNPLAFIPEAQRAGLKPHDDSDDSRNDAKESVPPTKDSESPGDAKPAGEPGSGGQSP